MHNLPILLRLLLHALRAGSIAYSLFWSIVLIGVSVDGMFNPYHFSVRESCFILLQINDLFFVTLSPVLLISVLLSLFAIATHDRETKRISRQMILVNLLILILWYFLFPSIAVP